MAITGSAVHGRRVVDKPATGQKAVMQCVWVYEHAIDFDGLCVTVGGEQRRQSLRDTGIEHVYDSRSLEFADLIRQ